MLPDNEGSAGGEEDSCHIRKWLGKGWGDKSWV